MIPSVRLNEQAIHSMTSPIAKRCRVVAPQTLPMTYNKRIKFPAPTSASWTPRRGYMWFSLASFADASADWILSVRILSPETGRALRENNVHF